MSIEGIIGIIITVALGAASLYFAIRRKKYPKRMEFYILDLVRIVSPYVRKYDSIKLLHNNNETKNVSFLRGMFMCSGDEDIVLHSSTQDNGMQIVMPAKYRWLEVHPQERTKGLEVMLSIDVNAANVLYVSSELFKRDEVFTFDAYIEAETEDRLEIEDIKVHHRIPDADKLETRYVNVERAQMRRRSLWSMIGMNAITLLMMGLFIFSFSYDRPFRYKDNKNADIEYSATLVNADSIAISEGRNGVLPWNMKICTIEEFNEKFEIDTSRPGISHRFKVSMIITFSFMFLSLLFGFIILGNRVIREKKVVKTYKKLMKKEEK